MIFPTQSNSIREEGPRDVAAPDASAGKRIQDPEFRGERAEEVRRGPSARCKRALYSPSALALWGLLAILGAAFLVRFLTLREIPYPPSSDAAGDLVWLHVYLGHSLPGYTIQQAPPPIYIVLVVLPFTALLGTFLGIQVLMATMAALLAVPAYLLMRWSGFGAVPALVAAAALAFSPVYSDMVTWNSGFNVTGILFLVLFFALWIRTNDHPSWKSLAVAGFAFSLVVGTHPLSAVYGVATVAIYLGIALVSRRRPHLPPVRFTVQVFGFAALFSLPYVPIYLYAFSGLANVGTTSVSAGLTSVAFSLSSTLAFPWWGNGPVSILGWPGWFVLAETVASGLALVLIWFDRRDRFLATLCVSQLLAAAVISPLDSANASRAWYFLPIALIPLTIAWVTRVAHSGVFGRVAGRVGSRFRSAGARRVLPMLKPVAVVVIAVGMVSATAYISQSQMRSSESFYSVLDSNDLAVLNWLKESTPPGAAVFDGADLQSWIPGYAERLSYAPGSLSGKITLTSYASTADANLIELGTSVLGNGYLYVGSNVPGVYSSPGIYLRTQSNSVPLWSSDASRTYVTVATTRGALTVSLAGASTTTTIGQVYSNGTASMSSRYSYPGLGVSIEGTVWLAQSAVSLVFAAENGTVTSVRSYWSLPPSGYYFTYDNIPFQHFNGSFVQTLSVFSTRTIDLLLNGYPLNGTVLTDGSGWTRMSLNFSDTARFEVQGASDVSPNNGTFYVSTSSLSTILGISYFVVSSATNYAVYQRLSALLQADRASWSIPFESGSIYVFQDGRLR